MCPNPSTARIRPPMEARQMQQIGKPKDLSVIEVLPL